MSYRNSVFILLVSIAFSFYSSAQASKVDSLYQLLKLDKEDTLKVRHLNTLAYLYRNSKPDSTILLCQQSIALCEHLMQTTGLKPWLGYSEAIGNMAIGYRLSGNFVTAKTYYFKALQIDEQIGNKFGMGKRMNGIGKVFENLGNYPKALEYGFKALKVNQEINNPRAIALSYGVLSNTYFDLNETAKGFEYGFKGLEIFESINDVNNVAATYNKFGQIYSQQKEFTKAHQYLNKALLIGQENKLLQQVAETYNIIGLVFIDEKKYDDALTYFLKGLKLDVELTINTGISNEYNYIGYIYMMQQKYALAESYLLKAIAASHEAGAMNNALQAESNLSELYSKWNKPTEALLHYKTSIALRDSIYSKKNTQQMMSIEFDKKEEAAIAEQEKKDAVAAAESKKQKFILFLLALGFLSVMIFAAFVVRSLSIRNKQNKIIEIQKKELENSYTNLELLNTISNEITASLNVESVMSEIYKNIRALMDVDFFIICTYDEKNNSIEAKYCVKNNQVVREDFKTSILNPNSYSAWTIKNKKEIIIADAQTERSKYLVGAPQLHGKEDIWTDSLLFFPLLVKEKVIGLYSVQSEKKNAYTKANIDLLRSLSTGIAVALNNADSYDKLDNANSEIIKQKQLVEEKQKDIIDSINYAQRIQYTLLASAKMLSENLPEHFILFKPKDIVSGDFYWATKKENRFYLAICDSTGHGVPGAFMSVLNASFLNEAINQLQISQPHLILNHVRKRLIESISNDGAQDGMDCTLLCFEGNKITYASANNKPVLIINNELLELQADKMPVGKSDKTDSFALHQIDLSLTTPAASSHSGNGLLYLFTDGYADQFGGDTGEKKLTKKKFKELLVSIHHLPMPEQKLALDKFITDYRKDVEQIDDILVMGVRV